jgi:hypothetical protein
VKLPLLVAVPSGVTTETVPDVAPAGTVVVIVESETTVKFPAPTLVPLNRTSVAPVKSQPEMVTGVPDVPKEGRAYRNPADAGDTTTVTVGVTVEETPVTMFVTWLRSE